MIPGISVNRTLPIDATLLSAVLLRLRRDVLDRQTRWNLGARGAVEMDAHFVPAAAGPGVFGPVWTTSARLWDPEQLALATAQIDVSAISADQCRLLLTTADLAPWWTDHLDSLTELADAALSELSEELLWHATRSDIAVTDA